MYLPVWSWYVDIVQFPVLGEVLTQLVGGHLWFERKTSDKQLTWHVGRTLSVWENKGERSVM